MLALTVADARWNHGAVSGVLRDQFFVRTVAAESLLSAPLETLEEDHGFLVDPPSVVEDWRSRLREIPFLKDGLAGVESIPDETERAKMLVRLFSAGPLLNRCSGSDDLVQNVELVHRGVGCCSDLTMVFLALASAVTLQAREVQTALHVAAEFYDHARRAWVFVDPEFAIMARGASGTHLSLGQLRDARFRGERVRFDFFGLTGHPQADTGAVRFYYGYADRLTQLILVMGNNVVSVDRSTRRLRWLPKPAYEAIQFLLGVRPVYVEITDAWHAGRRRVGRQVAVAAAAVEGFGLLTWPLLYLVLATMKWGRGTVRGCKPITD